VGVKHYRNLSSRVRFPFDQPCWSSDLDCPGTMNTVRGVTLTQLLRNGRCITGSTVGGQEGTYFSKTFGHRAVSLDSMNTGEDGSFDFGLLVVWKTCSFFGSYEYWMRYDNDRIFEREALVLLRKRYRTVSFYRTGRDAYNCLR